MPTSTLIHCFNDIEHFPLLDSYSTNHGSVEVCIDRNRGFMRLHWQRHVDDPPIVRVTFALPPKIIEGCIEKLMIEVLCETCDCDLLLDATDSTGELFELWFDRANATHWHTKSIDFSNSQKHVVSELTLQREPDSTQMVPPITLYRLSVDFPAGCEKCSVGLRTLRAAGDVRLLPSELA